MRTEIRRFDGLYLCSSNPTERTIRRLCDSTIAFEKHLQLTTDPKKPNFRRNNLSNELKKCTAVTILRNFTKSITYILCYVYMYQYFFK